MRLETPYAELLPPLSTEEYQALKDDLKANGQIAPVIIDENKVILDGHNRYSILKDKTKTKTVRGLSEAQKEAFVHRMANNRRNLSLEQKKVQREKMKATAKRLRDEDPKRWTQKRVAAELGVSQGLVSQWLAKPISNISSNKANNPDATADNNGSAAVASEPEQQEPAVTHTPDARTKLSKRDKEAIADRVESGESQAQVASDFGVSQATVSNVINKAREAAAKELERQALAEKMKAVESPGVVDGDFVKVAEGLDSGSVDLIFTDPPYHRKHLELYYDLGSVAARVLKPGGSLLVYCGTYLMPEVIAAVAKDDLRFFWCCACVHSGQKARMNEYGIVVGWKPILWFVRTGERRDHTAFIDDVVSGGREKQSHEWQQAEAEAAHFIEGLTNETEFVFDPFCGGGTTAAAAKRLKRRYLTCDIDSKATAEAKRRIAEVS